jgi:hypothetical protein
MNRRFMAGLAGIILPCFSGFLCAQPWSGIISPSRAIDWSNVGIPGGVPDRTTIYATLNPGATAAQINEAIASCPGSQVVFLNAGTYNLSGMISFSGANNVTLRGAGADQTKLVFSHGGSCFGAKANIGISGTTGNDQNRPDHSADWTAGYAKGTTVITLSSTTGLAVGNTLILDQADDSFDSGGIYVCSTRGTCVSQGSSAGRKHRGQQQTVVAQAIDGNNVTISPALYMPNWRSGQNPGAWWANNVAKLDGIENLTVESRVALGSGGGSIVMFNALRCWIRGVRSLMPNNSGMLQAHVRMCETAQSVVRDCYFYGSDHGQQSYGIEIFEGSDNLLENNLFQHITAATVINGPDAGSVIAYNYAIDDNYTGNRGQAPQWVQPMHVWHEVGEAMELYEGNQGLGFQADNIHGTHNLGTYFRNHYFGDIFNNPPKTDNTEIMHLWRYSRFFNMIGNVVGRVGYYDTYEGTRATSEFNVAGKPDNAITAPNDTVTATSLMRWGNYDTVSGAARFVDAEVPTNDPTLPNAVPASRTLPVSFYLSGQSPAWWKTPWGTPAWPPIGPDVTGGDIPGYSSHAYRIPARLCYENAGIDSSYGDLNVRVFNAETCYGTLAPPPDAAPQH